MTRESWFILGASGFLGSRLAARLLEGSEGPQLASAVDLERAAWLDDYPETPPSVFLEGNWLELPLAKLEEVSNRAQVWIICASVLPFRSRAFDHSANVRIAERVLDLYQRRSARGRPPFVVFISSSSIYGFPAVTPLNPNSAESPVDDYGKSKLAAEAVYRQIPKRDRAIIRPRTVLGRGRGGTVSALQSLSSRRLPIPVPSRKVLLQLCHVDDLVSLIVHVGLARLHGLWPAFSLVPKTLEDYVRQSASLIGRRQRLVRVPEWSEPLFRFIVALGITPFTNWHIAGFFRSHFFDPEWLPVGFRPSHTSQEAFDAAVR